MSDEINLATSNLCTTEDAFEQFQSASMYQEDEFITLSDITPVEDAAPDLSAGMVGIPYDNEVVLGSNLDEQVDNNAASSAELTELLPVSFSDNNDPAQPPTEEPTSSKLYESSEDLDQSSAAKPKRGRKRNNTGNDSVTNIPHEGIKTDDTEEGTDVQGNNIVSNEQFTSVELKPRGKRGRKPKNIQKQNDGQTPSGNTSASELSHNPVTKGRRGRPRKYPLGDTLANTASHRTNGNRLSNELPNHSDNLPSNSKEGSGRRGRPTSGRRGRPTSVRRGRPKQSKSVIVEAVENADCEEFIAPSEIDLSSMSMNNTIQKSPAKRGRKRKGKEGTKCLSNEKVGPDNEMQIPHSSSKINPDDDDDDDGDDISLSRLKASLDTDIGLESIETNITSNIDNQLQTTDDANTYVDVVGSEDTLPKRNDVPPELSDFELDVDRVIGHTNADNIDEELCQVEADAPNESFLVEDTSKRPVRRKIKQTLHYDDGSDEDPYANVELSDDEPRRKGKKYYSDDEYIPGGKKGKGSSSEDMSDSDIDDLETIGQLGKRKRNRNNSSQGKSPRKKGKKTDIHTNEQQPNLATVAPNVTTIAPNVDGADDDIEICLQSSVIKANDDSIKKGWGATTEFESFIAQKMHGSNLKIKKVSAGNSSQSLDIPVIDPKDAKKMVEISTQTIIQKTAVGVQTSTPYDLPMKKTVTLTAEQSERACEFLKGVVKTTSELGQLMTQKSEDFITKKINTNQVTDTMKMDYCVKKSFLLFKLAKHNLMQMEEDLSKQYDEFLKCNGLDKCREQPVKVEPKSKSADSDSDCEIVETSVPSMKQEKPKFNPKTVFLNKELSIKIAKKSSASEKAKTKEKLNVKGKHTVWISDSVMVKKVKPMQSFLAQDSRNKKPPDCYVTEEMVSDFFKEYYRKQVQSVCAPFTSGQWRTMDKNYVCCYFFDKPDKFPSSSTAITENDERHPNDVENVDTSGMNDFLNGTNPLKEAQKLSSPETLFLLCAQLLQSHMQPSNYIVQENIHNDNDTITDLNQQETPATLFRLCIKQLVDNTTIMSNCDNLSNILQHDSDENDTSLEILTIIPNITLLNVNHFQIVDRYCESDSFEEILSLKNLCYRRITDLFSINNSNEMEDMSVFTKVTNDTSQPSESGSDVNLYSFDEDIIASAELYYPDITSLFSLCVKSLQRNLITLETEDFNLVADNSPLKASLQTPKCLKLIALENVKLYMNRNCNLEQHMSGSLSPKISTTVYKVKQLADICFEIVSQITNNDINSHNNKTTFGELTINSVNTMSEEAFLNIGDACLEPEENSDYLDNEETIFYNDDDLNAVFDDNRTKDNEFSENQIEDNNWVSQVQMKELTSCFVPTRTNRDERQIPTDALNTVVPDEQPVITRIKIEPFEEIAENVLDSIPVKTEPVHHLNEMTVIPDSIVTKPEHFDDLAVDPLPRQDSYDADTFESYVQSNKLMYALNEFSNTSDDIFSQSTLRVRRQYDPDSDDEAHGNDSAMSLLVPQAFEPLHIETAKGNLMESSSDEGVEQNPRAKKKPERRRGRPKKTDTKQTSKDIPTKDKPPPVPPQPSINEVARLTKRMRDKIRQAEKIDQSSDSDSENLPLNKRKGKEGESSKSTASKETEDEIQCNNVDSTEQFENSANKDQTFSGFTALDQNEISSYHKYVKFVYDKILPKVTADAEADSNTLRPAAPNENVAEVVDERSESPLINHDDPVEMLECVPTMPIFDDDDSEQPTKVRNKNKGKPKSKISVEKSEKKEKSTETQLNDDILRKDIPTHKERNGWHCYPIDMNDTQLHKEPGIFLEKLPESFVETYFRYQNVTDIGKEDVEVDRLINLQSLNRNTTMKEVKSKTKSKGKTVTDEQIESELASESRPASPANSDNYAELTPSEDEHNVNDEEPPPVPLRQTTENNLAKTSLMNDNDSESENPIKQEPNAESPDPTHSKATPKGRSKKAQEKSPVNPESLMLTADKMMNKELNLLHAPVILKHDPDTVDKATGAKKHKIRSKTNSTRDRIKMEEDSSSEEEKQWVSYKEKLLKKIGKKQDTSVVDDAKRAKIVSEFIERRGDAAEPSKRGRGRNRRRISKKMLEREKQLRVLSKELYGENSADGTGGRRVFSQSYFKGRRNIRKVIDKKSLARSTVIANMEELERKRSLNERQSRLREELGCEDDVNVLVINDEVCLEYDFQVQAPVVAVHPFFTKVMKAHQYEGVKFMWDACFESLDKIESGHRGGGCILAHCMGLGKTLQVLALLHTVLTHPRVGMHRVLVCCPLSTVLNWVDEIHKWIGPVTDNIKVFELSKLKKTYERAYQLEDWYNGGGIFIIGYELFRSLTTLDPVLDDIRPTIVEKIRLALLNPGPDIIVCDEGHLLKNDCSVLAVAMSRVLTRRRIILTGTPMQNNLREYYCMVNFVKPNLLGTYSEYSNRFENPIMNGQHRDSQQEDIILMKTRTHILHKVLEGCLQRQEASVLYPYLPKKHEYTVFVALTKCQWDLYKHYLHHYAKESKQSILKDFHTLQKIWSHPQVLHNFQMRTRDASGNKIKPEKLEDDLATEDLASENIKPSGADEMWWQQYLEGGKMLDTLESSNKFVTVFRILDECVKLGDKILIFSTSLVTMDSLEFFLKSIKKWSLGQEYYRLDGSLPPEVRQKWCRDFNAEHNLQTKVFLISTRAGSLGLNMVAANRVIILDTSWNPAHDIQSIFRVYRFGQKKDCYIYRLVALGTMEQKIYERSVTKQAVSCRVVDEQQIDRHYNMAELTELYGYDEAGVGVAGGVAVGVTDVALLRVARHAALHAVHEHDSLLRGSSEQGLPEHERAAAWMQFQQEHAHKQMQNQLTSSYMLQIPQMQSVHSNPANLANIPLKQKNTASHTHPPEVKLEPSTKDTKPIPEPAPQKPRKGRPRKEKVQLQCRIPVQSEEPALEPPSQMPVDDDVVKKIMNLLIKHKFHDKQRSHRDVANLVSNVRKIVAYGKVPDGQFDKELTESIANVLLCKDPTPPLTDVEQPVRKRPGKRKHKIDEPSTSAQADLVEELHREPTPEEPEVTDGRRRRKAALRAEKHFDEIDDDPVIDLDADEDWHGGSDLESHHVAVPKAPSKKSVINTTKPTIKMSKSSVSKANKKLNSDVSSILLSDDEESAAQAKQTDNSSTSIDVKPLITAQEVIPLHPSLLSNKNFIKIVAHTYLEGNPMLDEDAATLAAQYSTQKALQEYENSGKTITSGPIYDIATKVLGIDILKKLHKTNPQVKPSTAAASAKAGPVIAKAEPVIEKAVPPPPAPKPKVKAKGLTELLEKPSRPPPLGFGITTTRFAVAPAAGASAGGPSVVPVGLFKRAGNILPDEPEESILPDDDDVRIVSDPTPAPDIKPVIKIARPTSQVAKGDTPAVPVIKANMAKTIQINSGKIMMASPDPTASTVQSDTICLDSDEEVIPEPVTNKRVALKSTAKKQIPHVIPVTISAADLQPRQQFPTPTNYDEHANQPQPLQNKNFVVIPASQLTKLTKLPKGVSVPPISQRLAANEMPQNVYAAPQNTYATPQNAYPIPQNMTFINTIPQNVNMMTSVPHNYNMAASMPQNVMSSMPQNTYTSMPQNTYTSLPQNAMSSMPQNVMSSMPQNAMSSMPQNAMSSMPQNAMSSMPQTTYTPMPQNTYAPMSQNYAPMQQNLMNPAQHMNTIPGMGMVPQMNMHQMNSEPLSPMQINEPPQAATSSELILPTDTSATAQKKTVCKPGDILRITSSGHVEILNRNDQDDDEPKVDSTTHKKNKPPKKLPRASESRKSTSKKAIRIRAESSSSSSSDNSRPPSPDDPLAILRDVVHIAAPEDANDTSRSRSNRNEPSITVDRSTFGQKDNVIGSTSITRSEKKLGKTPTLSKATASSKPTAVKSGVTIAPTKDKVMKSSVLDKNVSSKPTALTSSVTITSTKDKVSKSGVQDKKTMQTTKTRTVYESVDLTDWDEPSSRSVAPKTYGKPASKTDKMPSTIVGTSKNIIISGSGKATSLVAKEQSSKKAIRVTNVEKVAPGPAHKSWSDLKKRPSSGADPSAPKKKKTEPMTLKDFDIDDIDDIIELE